MAEDFFNHSRASPSFLRSGLNTSTGVDCDDGASLAEAFGDRLTRSMVTVPQLPSGYLVEIEAIPLQ
jgi:hypothetical protein